MRRSSRLPLVVGLLLLLVLVGAGYLYLSGYFGETPGGGLEVTATPVPTMRIVVPNRNVQAETVLKPSYVEENFGYKDVLENEVPSDKDIVIVQKGQLYNKVSRVPLDADQYMRQDQFADASLSYLIPEGKRAFPVLVDRYSGVMGEIVPQDFVDVVLSGPIELHYPRAYPPEYDAMNRPPIEIAPTSMIMNSVKTLIQDVEVLQVTVLSVTQQPIEGRPTPTPLPEGAEAPEEEGPLPTRWVVILAVDDQQAEILQFAVAERMGLQLILRPRGDHNLVATRGITTWILIESYGLPVPQAVPYEVTPGSVPRGYIP
ncbi:MAG: Flp pilus assembly protein CpaB [Chloroflexia bacterium]|nr:Flp pilus assembly protein CpaB [Chloroflexia bacterium]